MFTLNRDVYRQSFDRGMRFVSRTNTMPEEATLEVLQCATRIGLDWADQKHFWSMKAPGGKIIRGQLNNTPEAIDVWASELAQRFSGQPVAVALEQSRGAVIAMLSKYAHIILFPVHPNTVANYRLSFSPSRAKGDPSDGDLILDLLEKHPERLRRLRPDTWKPAASNFSLRSGASWWTSAQRNCRA